MRRFWVLWACVGVFYLLVDFTNTVEDEFEFTFLGKKWLMVQLFAVLQIWIFDGMCNILRQTFILAHMEQL